MTRERPKPQSVCAVIPTYNCRQPLGNCLDILQRQTRAVDEVIVVDNASTDGTREMIQARFAGSVTCVQLPENLGGAGGFDCGMRLAHGHGHDWIWCLDSDALPEETTLENLLSASHPSTLPVVAKTCVFRHPETGTLYQGVRLKDRRGRGRQDSPGGRWEGEVVAVDAASLCCLLVRADAAQRAGFIDKDLFISWDEAFFSFELRKLGEIIQVGSVVVSHPYAGGKITSTRHGRERMVAEASWRMYYIFRNQFLFERHYYGLWRAIAWGTYSYTRAVGGIILFDDQMCYRIGLLTRALWDGLNGRRGKRVDPQDFRRRHKSLVPGHGTG